MIYHLEHVSVVATTLLNRVRRHGYCRIRQFILIVDGQNHKNVIYIYIYIYIYMLHNV